MRNEFNESGEEQDRELSSPSQLRVREIVRSLPEETLSLSWRSDLNARIRAESARLRKRILFGWIWKPAAGLTLAGALAVAVVFRIPTLPRSPSLGIGKGEVERALIKTYVESTAAREAAVDGVTASEAKDSADGILGSGDWDQEDVGATL